MAWHKDPDETLDYCWDWSQILPSGDTISSVTWTVAPGLTKENSTASTTTATVWVSGGTVGERYPIACKVTTVAGRIFERTQPVEVIHR